MQAFLMPNDKPESLGLAQKAGIRFLSLGGSVLVDEKRQKTLQIPNARYAPFYECTERCDLILAVGGDGTILHAARHALEKDKMVLGLNAGYLGFLAQAEQDELDPLFERLLNGNYQVEERFVLSASIRGGREYSAYAINDAVIARGHASSLAGLEFYCNGKYMDRFRADGVIFSTPTGSTAYSLSAGGPIVDPTMDTILVTPISPHRLTARAILFSSDKTLVVQPWLEGRSVPLYLSVDGSEPQLLRQGEHVEVKKASKTVRFITFGEKEFFEILTKKIVQRG